MKAVVATHQRDDEAEYGSLDESRGNVLVGDEVDRVLEVDAAAEAEALRRHHIAAEYADRIGDRHQYRHGDDGGDQARHDEIFDRIGGKRCQRVDLLGDAHRADLRGDGGGNAAGDHQTGDDRPKLARNAEHDDLRHNRFGAVAIAADVDLQGEHAAPEERGQSHHRQGEVTDAKHLTYDMEPVDGRSETTRHRGQREQAQAADLGEEGEDGAANRGKNVHAAAST